MKRLTVESLGLSLLALAICSALLASGCAAQDASAAVSGKAAGPAAPTVSELPLKSSVSQYGITWTFDRPVPVGQFVNGDWYVVGPVTVTAIDPKPLIGAEAVKGEKWTAVEKKVDGKTVKEFAETDPDEAKDAKGDKFTRNGSVVNPPPVMGKSGFDSRAPFHMFDAALTRQPPVALQPGDSLISTISAKELTRRGHYTPVKDMAILTCLKEPVPADAFRPGYMDRKQTIYLARNLNRAALPKLAAPGEVPPVEDLAKRFAKPWFLLNVFKGDHAWYQYAGYGQRSCFYLGQAFLYLCLDVPAEKKEPVLLGVTQLGIDCWAIVKSGHPGFPAWGGWNSGYKMPIVLAGYLLGDEVMASPSKAYPKCSFQEDEQTAYGPAWNGAKVVFTGHSGYDAATLQSRDKTRGSAMWGFYEHLHPSFWVQDQVQSDGYRRCCNSRTWQAQCLVMRLMKLEKYWAHDAFFDYMDRWMYQTETDEVWAAVNAANIRVGWKAHNDWARQGQVEDKFAAAMWAKYRTMPGMPPTDGWKTLKVNENGLVMPEVKMPDPNAPTPPPAPKKDADK